MFSNVFGARNFLLSVDFLSCLCCIFSAGVVVCFMHNKNYKVLYFVVSIVLGMDKSSYATVIKLGCICMRCCCGMNEVRKSSISNVRLGSEYTSALSKGLLKRKNTNSFNITRRHFRDTVSKNPNLS